MTFAEQTFRAFFTERDFGRAFAVHAEREPVAEIGAKLHRYRFGLISRWVERAV